MLKALLIIFVVVPLCVAFFLGLALERKSVQRLPVTVGAVAGSGSS